MSNSIEILSHTAELSYAGAKAKGDGYYNTSDGLHTVASVSYTHLTLPTNREV